MPELPEVETIRRSLSTVAEGRLLRELEILDPRWCEPLAPAEFRDAVVGRRVLALERRGKYLLWRLEGEVNILMHLRMTGVLLLDPPADQRYVRVRFELAQDGEELAQDGGELAQDGELAGDDAVAQIAFVDPRRFGTGELALGDDALERFLAGRLGVEPLQDAFTVAHLRALARGRRAPIKAFLLDQRMIAGVGNIYADEALFRARIHPLRPAGSLGRAQWEALRAGVQEALLAGIDARGASIDDYRDLDGAKGTFQDRFLVHTRAGQPCPRCGRDIVKLVAAGRGTYVCRHCQRPPRRRVRG